jgi:hypothetical protein
MIARSAQAKFDGFLQAELDHKYCFLCSGLKSYL